MICLNPFDTLYVQSYAYTTCCPSWVRTDGRTGRTMEQDPWRIWNHAAFVRLRRDVLEGGYERCVNCVKWLDGLPDGAWPPHCQPIMREGPKRINLANDQTCNLHCWTCRAQAIVEIDVAKKKQIQDRMLSEFLPTASLLSVSHSGDPFASPMHRQLLLDLETRHLGDLQIEIFTNGLLLPRYWPQLGHIADRLTRVSMSIDAATRQTYERTRCGGSWDAVLAALDLLARQRLSFFAVNMVVQADNFREIGDFVRLGLDHNATTIQFTLLRPWPHLSRTQYLQHSLADPSHPDHREFLNVLEQNRELLKLPQVRAAKLMSAGQALIQRMHHE